jgi:hypothetical protein
MYTFFGLNKGVRDCIQSPYVPPIYLGLIRLLLGLYMFTSFLVHFLHLITQKQTFVQKQGWKLLGDILIHCYLGQAVYFLISAYHTITFASRCRKSERSKPPTSPLTRWPKPLQLAHILLQTTVLALPLFCTVIYCYWTLPAQPKWLAETWTRWSTITFYMLNTLFSYVELFMSASQPRPWSHLIVVLLLLGFYLGFHSILVAASKGKIWVYTVFKFSLRMNRGWISAARVFGLCGLAIGSFCIMQCVLWVKCRYLNDSKKSSVDDVEDPPLDDGPVHRECYQNA